MAGRIVIFLALALYGLVLAVAIAQRAPTPPGRTVTTTRTYQPSTQPTVRADGLPYRSVAIQVGWIQSLDRFKQAIDEVAAVGFDTILIVTDARQENGTSSRIYLDQRIAPSPKQLGELIQHAKSRKLRAMLMPIVLLDNPRGSEWRGTLKPESWGEWFESYRTMITHFARVAQDNGVDVLVVGSELVSAEEHLDEWTRTIQAIRGTFKGQLTYSSNWDHYTSVPFWDQLDLIGMNSYWSFATMSDPNPTPQQIQDKWNDIQKDLLPFVQAQHKPLLFLEIGWFSQANVAYEPWDYTKINQPIDLELQAKLYEGFFKAWYGNPLLGGFSVWEWSLNDGGKDDRGYTPKGKPAEDVLREWLAKRRWEVKQ